MPLPEDESVVKVSEDLVKELRTAFHAPPSVRVAHAKGRLARGIFVPSRSATTLSTAPHFHHPSTPILAHFSSSTGFPQISDTDPSANPRGFALRFILSEDGHKHTDIVTHSTRFFPTRTGEGFLTFLEAIANGALGDYLAQHPAAKAFIDDPKPSPQSFATEQFWGVNAFILTNASGEETHIRYRVVPDAGSVTLSDDQLKGKSTTYLYDELVERLGKETITFRLVAQIAGKGDVTDDATVPWPEEREQVELGVIVLNAVLSDEESAEAEKQVIFDPVPRVPGVEPSADPLLEVRAASYLISGRMRRTKESA